MPLAPAPSLPVMLKTSVARYSSCGRSALMRGGEDAGGIRDNSIALNSAREADVSLIAAAGAVGGVGWIHCTGSVRESIITVVFSVLGSKPKCARASPAATTGVGMSTRRAFRRTQPLMPEGVEGAGKGPTQPQIAFGLRRPPRTRARTVRLGQ